VRARKRPADDTGDRRYKSKKGTSTGVRKEESAGMGTASGMGLKLTIFKPCLRCEAHAIHDSILHLLKSHKKLDFPQFQGI
jgi:hypothetical protein